jgi:putative FmdB family regulatory protein
MPRYQYECHVCQENFETKQRFSEEPLKDCPVCGAEDALERVIGPVSVIFKGSGFYITDSKKNGKTKVDSTSKSSDTDSSKSKGDSKEKASTSESKSEKKAAD